MQEENGVFYQPFVSRLLGIVQGLFCIWLAVAVVERARLSRGLIKVNVETVSREKKVAVVEGWLMNSSGH